MKFFYDLNPVKSNGRPAKDADPNAYWAKHHAAAIILTGYMKSRDFDTKQRANEELTIAERKKAFWEKRPGFDISAASKQAFELKKILEK